MFSGLELLLLAGMDDKQIKKIRVTKDGNFAFYKHGYLEINYGVCFFIKINPFASNNEFFINNSLSGNLFYPPAANLYCAQGYTLVKDMPVKRFNFVSSFLKDVVKELLMHLEKEKFMFDKDGYLSYALCQDSIINF